MMVRAVKPKTVIFYQNENGKEPFSDWFNSLRDQKGKERILNRLRRLESGLYGDCEPVGEGVFELRMLFGPGYRIYFGEEGNHIVILITGGSKNTQNKDIKVAKKLWKEYLDNG